VTPAPIAIHTDGAVACATVLWRVRGSLRLTVVVKAAFSVVPDGVVVPAPAPEIVAADRHHDGSPLRSVQAASDLAPYLPRCDVLFTGYAYAPSPGATAGAVRLGIAREGRRLLDKTLHVYGDRGPGGALSPFTRIPMVYERALGGPGMPNPVGTQSPNITEPRNAQQAAGFAPISRRWPARKIALGGLDPRALEAPIAEIPESMPWEYFQAAPLDQHIEPLIGGEWLVLDGLHPTRPRMQTRLPSARGAARIEARRGGHEAAGEALDLVCDTLAIDGDRGIVTLSWRGVYEVAEGEAALPSLVVKAALETPGVPVDWARIGAAPAPDEHTRVDTDLAALRPVPFGPSGAPARAPSTEATPWGAQPIRRAPAPRLDQTLPTEPSPIGAAREAETTRLYAAEHAEARPRPAIPFPQPTAAPRPVADEIPGAPWSSVAAPQIKEASAPEAPTLFETPAPRFEALVPAATPPAGAIEPAPPVEPAAPAPEPPAPPPEPAQEAPIAPAATAATAGGEALPLDAFPIERCAAIAASVARRAEDRAKILEDNDLTPARWDALLKHWTDAIREENKRGRTALLSAYDRAYVARLEEERGPIRVEEYAQLRVATERGNADAALEALTLPRGAMLRLQRVWAGKIAADAALGASVREATEAARNA
jgi:hypothetical protein